MPSPQVSEELRCSELIDFKENTAMEYFILAFVWTVYFVFHSMLISTKATEIAKLYLGNNYRFYRLFYNIFSIASLIPVVWYSNFVPKTLLFEWGGTWNLLRFSLLAGSGLLAFLALKEYDMQHFLGFKQIQTGNIHRVLSAEPKIKTNGILGIIRHPLYTSLFPLVWLREISMVVLIENVIITAYLIIGTYLEEQKLVKEFGTQYIDYKKHVSMFLPYKYLLRKLKKLRMFELKN